MELAEEQSVRIQSSGESLIALDDILDGLEEALALERELGASAFEVDRALLVAPPAAGKREYQERPEKPEKPEIPEKPEKPEIPEKPGKPDKPEQPEKPKLPEKPEIPVEPEKPAGARRAGYEFVFLADGVLSPSAREMMERVAAYMGKTLETAPLVCDGGLPHAKIHIVLGSTALKKWFPGKRAAPGQWFDAGGGAEAVVTRSPDRVLKATTKETLLDLKKEMQAVFKTVLQRIKQK